MQDVSFGHLRLCEYAQNRLEPSTFGFGKDAQHGANIIRGMICGECIVVGNAIFVFYAYRKESRLHENEIGEKPPCPAVAVDERMNRLESNMEYCCSDQRMQPRGCQVAHPLFHQRLHETRLRRSMDGTGDNHWNPPVRALYGRKYPTFSQLRWLIHTICSSFSCLYCSIFRKDSNDK